MAEKVCIKIDNLRKLGYSDLSMWMKDPKNLYTGRFGRIFITNPKTKEKQIFHYNNSKWHNPFKIDSAKGINSTLKLYLIHLFKTKLIYDIKELDNYNLGCFCIDENCHAQILSDFVNCIFHNKKPKILTKLLKNDLDLKKQLLKYL